MKKLIWLFTSFLMSSHAFAKINLLTTTTDIAWAAKQIGGEHVEVEHLLNGTENIHFVDALPNFIVSAAKADILCFIGLDMEAGWLPKIQERSGNSKIQSGGKGLCELGKRVETIDKPQGNIDRSMGDVHPGGNPHFWLSPFAFAKASEVILDTLISNDPANTQTYKKNYELMVKTIESTANELKAEVAKTMSAKQDPKVIQYHADFVYFFAAYGFRSVGSIEEKPGLQPSAAQIAKVSAMAKQAGVKLALALDYHPKSVLDKFKEFSGVKYLILPASTRQSDKQIDDYLKLQKHLVSQILKEF